MPHDQHRSLKTVDGGHNNLHLVPQGRGCSPVSLPRKGQGLHPVAFVNQPFRDIGPRRCSEPQAWKQNDVHALTLYLTRSRPRWPFQESRSCRNT